MVWGARTKGRLSGVAGRVAGGVGGCGGGGEAGRWGGWRGGARAREGAAHGAGAQREKGSARWGQAGGRGLALREVENGYAR